MRLFAAENRCSLVYYCLFQRNRCLFVCCCESIGCAAWLVPCHPDVRGFIDYALDKSPYLRYDYFTGTFRADVYRKLGNKHVNEELAAFREAKADPDKLVQLFQRYFPASEVHRPCDRTEQAREYLKHILTSILRIASPSRS